MFSNNGLRLYLDGLCCKIWTSLKIIIGITIRYSLQPYTVISILTTRNRHVFVHCKQVQKKQAINYCRHCKLYCTPIMKIRIFLYHNFPKHSKLACDTHKIFGTLSTVHKKNIDVTILFVVYIFF